MVKDNPIKKYDVKKIMLIVTEDCNLKCSYCYEHEKSSKIMNFEIAKNIIDREFVDIDLYEKGVIEFFGGEAFLNFSLIKQVYEYVMDKYPNQLMLFYNTTNGTLVHGEIQEWLYEHKSNFICSISLDGTKEMHNLNRSYRNGKGSFDDIDLVFFKKTWPNIAAKLTTSEETLPMLAEGVKYIESLGMECIATFATGIEWSKNDNFEILIQQLLSLIKYYEERPEQKLCKMLDFRLESIFEPIDELFRYCGAGVMMRCYDTEGNWYPCQGFAPVSIGEKSKEFLKCDFMNFRLSENNPCKYCKFLKVCTTCFAANYNTTGNLEKQCHEICYFNRLCVLASSKLQYNRLMLKSNSEQLDLNDQLVLKAISIIQNEIMDEEKKYL